MIDATKTLLIKSAPLLLWGMLETVALSLGSIAIGLCLGLLTGIVTCKRLRVSFVAPLLDAYVFCVRGIPFFVQLLLVYFVLPDLAGINLSPFAAGVLALGLCSTGYVAEIVRSSLNALPEGQWDACRVLGYSKRSMLRFVILPQMFGQAIPTLANEFVAVVLSTSIISQIGALELTKAGANIIARTMNPIVIYGAIAVLYLMITTTIMIFTKWLERRGSYARR